MLLEFSVANYRSIRELCVLSMQGSSGISDTPKENIFEKENNKILKTSVIYGANSSGKSNVVNAINQMKRIILSSVKLNDEDLLEYNPFLLSSDDKQPSHFEVLVIIGSYKYRYGFESNEKEICEEWLFRSTLKGKEEKRLFYRDGASIEVNNRLFSEGKGKESITNSNRLFISLCAQLGGGESKQIVSWFNTNINIISGVETDAYTPYSTMMLQNKTDGYSEAKSFFKQLQLGFNDIECVESEFDASQLQERMPERLRTELDKKFAGKKSVEMFAIHNVYNEEGEIVDKIGLDVSRAESLGTQKLIQLSGPIFDTLKDGKVLVIDELDAKMHPHISNHIINLFNNPKSNPKGAQLIFTTHDTHLLSSRLFRRDQIWFTEKNSCEQTDLYNMLDIVLPDGSKPRNDANYEKNYIAGRYGAIPYIINE